MSTTSPSTTIKAELLENNDYQTLIDEIKATIDKNDKLFQQIQRANYPNAGNYSSDLLNYKIETEGRNLEDVRNQVWEYLTRKYEENTKLRSYYFSEIRKADEHIATLDKQQRELIDIIQTKKLNATTANQSIKSQKYQFDKLNYYLFLYKILIVIQIIILAILSLCIISIIPKATALILIVIILIATLAFVGYYVFYVNIGRNAFNWAKFEHDSNISAIGGSCADNGIISEKDKEKVEIDKKVNELIEMSNSGNCSANVEK
jgi:hypothetical protein